MRTEYRRRIEAGGRGATMGELARKHNVRLSTARSAILGHTWRDVPAAPVERAKTGGWSVVSAADQEEIIRRRSGDNPDSYAAIGRDLGHDKTVIYHALRRAGRA